MSSQHLSDEAVAACADGVLVGHARERATRHIGACAECAHAVRVQREAAWALRAAPAPCLPSGLLDRLRTVPHDAPAFDGPAAFDPDGTPMRSTLAPMAALVPPADRPGHRTWPAMTWPAISSAAAHLFRPDGR